jgi:glyoxylase-like metal-dependent hydrolase (beta-lactamase superfamily II)
MPLIHTFQLGELRCHALEGGIQRLDGGAMFGVVPKPLWEKRIAPDPRNRIALALRCLLVEHPAGLLLIDTGLGNKEDAKFREIYGVENAGPGGSRTRIEAALAEAGYGPEQVRWVLNTHLHFDHAGGNTWIDQPTPPATSAPPPLPRLSFPDATYLVQAGDLAFARQANERTRASYLPHNWEPVAEAGKFRLLEGDGEVFPGVSVRLIPGHVPFLQGVLLESRGERLFYLADLIPTRHHLPLPWIMGYDVEPLRTLETKRRLLQDALRGDWWLFFEHDPELVMARLEGSEQKLALRDAVAAPAG